VASKTEPPNPFPAEHVPVFASVFHFWCPVFGCAPDFGLVAPSVSTWSAAIGLCVDFLVRSVIPSPTCAGSTSLVFGL
jgi:hypothetical protein